MSEVIIAALVSAAAAIVVGLINSRAQHNKLIAELDKRDELQAYRIEQLERKVDKHNQVIARTYKLEECAELLGERIKVANHRIDDLEHKN
nr:MAG TPA_asm: hemolysin XhlA [Caudoviricetes sp.]